VAKTFMARTLAGALACSTLVIATPAQADVDRGYVEIVGSGATITVRDLTKVGSDNDPITDIDGAAQPGERIQFVVQHKAVATGTCRIQGIPTTDDMTTVVCDPATVVNAELGDRRDKFVFTSRRPIDFTVDSGTGNDKVNVFVYGQVSDVSVTAGQGKDVVNVEQRQGGTVNGTLRGGGLNDRLTLKGTGFVAGDNGNDVVNVKNGRPNTVDCGGFNDRLTIDVGLDTLVNCP